MEDFRVYRLAERRLNVMDPFALPLSYKFIATSLMLVQVNLFCEKANLPLEHPITPADIRSESHVGPPDTNNFSGSIVTDRYAFGFGQGHLANFVKRGFTPNSDAGVKERNRELAKLTSQIDTNGAYELVTNWLYAVGVDVVTLESKYQRSVTQWKFYPEVKTDGQLRPQERHPLLLPVFQVEWRGELVLRGKRLRERPIVSITLSGITKELLEYHNLDDSLMLNARIEIREPQRLLAISDAAFQAMNTLQRSNLVMEFSTMHSETPNRARQTSKNK